MHHNRTYTKDIVMNRFFQLLALLALAGTATAQNYPSKPVRMLVGYSAGGPTDLAARILAEQLSQKLGQPFIVENRAGANGTMATQFVMASPPDGHTLLISTSGALTVQPAMIKSMPYSPLNDLAPVSMLAGFPYFLTVHPSVPVNDVKSLVAYLKSRPGQISYSSAGPGTVNHMAGEWFKELTKVDIVHVPYKGDASAVVDLIAGHVQMGFTTLTTSMPHVKTGRLKALALTSPRPTELAAGFTPMVDLGFPDFIVEPWNGVFGPAKLPPAVTQKLNEAINQVLSDPKVQARIAETGQYVIIESPAVIRARIVTQTERWRQVARLANLQPE